MEKGKARKFYLFSGLGFIAVIAAGLFLFTHSRGMLSQYDNFSSEIHREHVDYVYTTTLTNIIHYIEKQYPFLHETWRFRQEAGTAWFWGLVNEWREMAETLGLEYIHYIEKSDQNYIYLLSSDMSRNGYPGRFAGPVWDQTPPSFVDDAWRTRRLAISPINAGFVSAAQPVLSDGEVSGILLISMDYNISFMDAIVRQETHLQEQTSTMLYRFSIILIVIVIALVLIMAGQIWLTRTSLHTPMRELEAEERTRLMLDAMPMICALMDTKGRLLDCNQETLRIFGLENKAEYLGHFYDFCPEYQPNGERSRTMIARIITEVLKSGYQRLEWMHITRSGEELPVDVTIVRVPWRDDFRFTAYARDLREIKAKEAIVRETENRLRVMVDSMAFACLFFDPSGKLLDCNHTAINFFGSADKKELLEHFYNFSPKLQPDGENSSEKGVWMVRHAFETGHEEFSWIHQKKDGYLLPVEVSLVRVKWQDSYRVVAYLRDITKLTETEDNLRSILAMAETAPSFIVRISEGGEIEYMNPSAEVISGYSREELTKAGMSVLFSPEDYQRLLKEHIAKAEEKASEFEMNIIAKDGTKRDIYFSIFTVQTQYGSARIGVVGRDVTYLKSMQRELAAAKEAAERALETEVQYNKAKSNFLSRMSHELRTPMNAIMGMTDIARKAIRKNKPESCIEKIDQIDEASKHLLGILNDVLDMASIDTGKFELEPRQFNFSEMMRSITDEINSKAAAKKQTFTANIDNKINEMLIGDERRVKQILGKLLSNAVKFTPEKGRVALSVQLAETRESECRIHFEVSDNGIGIGKDVQERLGGSFEQEHNSITREYGGMGLGLSLAKRIVEMMNGRIWVDSETGKGSCFMFDICLGKTPEASSQIPGVPPGGEHGVTAQKDPEVTGINPHDLAGRRILIVDDVEINRVILQAVLEDTGAVLDEAQDGAEAVKLVSENKYDLVLMDLHMPIMDGFTATRAIRSAGLPWSRTLPVISVSAESSADLPAKLQAAGMTAHLTKPVEMEALFKMIASVL